MMPNLSSSSRLMAAAFLAVAVPSTDAFSIIASSSSSSKSNTKMISSMDVATCTATSTALLLQRQLAERHFQLEELEDCETSTTDVLLNTDRSVALGGTNGPLYTAGHGTWDEKITEDQSSEGEENFKRFFQMKLMRTFITGADGSDPNEMGEFEYTVERTYNGECFMVGGSTIAMNGEILDVDEIFGERRVGFFNMIDTTEERERNLMDGENGQQVE